ncbi:hypothetical protein LPB137_11875 [Poseidonibacter parvus]|uniref:Uncharacterized protein n=1 Tax=Poseidonibacter parvus TaxID=1850254 RepID=A0A1P8KPG0_9BACT|nr:hypothetical protein [Poseidonibacter parvus]APW66494.1 hypothetical protein LPB137_11875 [Poseidonibacter parvus]
MSKEIEKILKKIKNWEDEYIVKEYINIKEDEISNLYQWQKNKDFNKLLNFWKDIISQEYLELDHPIIPNLKTRAIESTQIGTSNFVIFADENLENPWILGQLVRMVDIIVTMDNIYRSESILESNIVLSSLNKIESVFINSLQSIKYNVKFAGFRLQQPRPYHHFYDQINYLYLLENNYPKKILCEKTFFLPENFDKGIISDGVYLIPSLMHGISRFKKGNRNLEFEKVIEKIDERMEHSVYTQSMKDFDKIVRKEDFDLILWFSISVEKRSWIDQNEAFINIVNLLKKYFKTIKIYIDGMTAEDGLTIQNKEEEEIFKNLDEAFIKDKSINLTSLIGKDYKTKICYCSTINLFITSAGTSSIIPLRFCKKPGVLHSNSKLWLFGEINTNTIKCANHSMIIDIKEKGKPDDSFDSYYIPWQHIYNLTAEVLNQIKGTNIKIIDVPTEKIEKLRDTIFKDYIVPESHIIKEFNELKGYDICWKDYHKNNMIEDLSTDPIIHYINNWRKMNLSINDIFDTFYYLEKYPDIKKAKVNPLLHFYRHGIKENRKGIKSE